MGIRGKFDAQSVRNNWPGVKLVRDVRLKRIQARLYRWRMSPLFTGTVFEDCTCSILFIVTLSSGAELKTNRQRQRNQNQQNNFFTRIDTRVLSLV